MLRTYHNAACPSSSATTDGRTSSQVYGGLFSRLSLPVRAQIGLAAGAGLVGRFAFVVVATRVSSGDASSAVAVGVFGAVAYAVQRALSSFARVGAECDLYAAVSRSLLRSDVLRVPAEDLQRVVFESNHHARSVLVGTLPQLVADIATSVMLVPILVAAFPSRILMLAAASLVAVLISLSALRRISLQLQARVLEAFERVASAMVVVVEARLELAAQGQTRSFSRNVEDALDQYSRLARRGAVATAMLGRAPFALGASVFAVGVALDAGTREMLAAALVAKALLLAASAPALLGIVFGIQELTRSRALIAPLAAILGTDERPELARVGAAAPRLPGRVGVADLRFRYEDSRPPVLTGTSFDWDVGQPLVLVGPNGTGKSTLLRLLIQLRPPSAGRVSLDDFDLARGDLESMRRDVAFLPQRPYLGEGYHTVREAMSLMHSDSSDEDMTRALERTKVLETLHARSSSPLEVRVGELSAGQRQRIALARILLSDAKLVLLDEPDANLDARGIKLVAELIREMTAQGKMVAVAAHTPELAEMPATRIALG